MQPGHNDNSTHGPRLRLHQRMAIIFFVFAALVSGLTAYVLYQTAQDQVMRDIRQRLGDIVAVAAQSLDANLHDQLQNPSQQESPAYKQLKAEMQAIRDASSDIHFIYTMRQDSDGRIAFVVDAEEDPQEMAALGEIYEEASDLLSDNFSKLDRPLVEDSFYTDKWGTWLSGYAPILRADGTRAGVLGADISAATVLAYEDKLLLYALAAFAVILPLILTLGYLVGRAIARPITTLQEGAQTIADGDLAVHLDLRRGDEIGALAQTFNHMTAKLAENRSRLAEMADKYRKIFDNAVEGIFQADLDGRVITANQAFCRILGYDDLEQLQSEVRDLARQVCAREQDREELVELLTNESRVSGMRLPFMRRDGSRCWVELNAHVIPGDGEQPAIEGMVQDITSRMAKEEAERKAKSAEAASQAKSEFLANMSHEIRTPLNAVMGLADLMRRTELNPKQTQYLAKIKTASQSLLAVINDILDFSKIEAGRLELEHGDFSLQEVMANLSEMFAHQAHEKDIELVVSIDKDAPAALRGDPVRLAQVLINLTSNAIKFTERGEVVVNVAPDSDGPQAGPGQVALEFSVQDTGAGIPSDRLKGIFEAFTQADSSITRKHGGTGLGLAICQRITQLMGGELKVESTPGQGSRFSFTALFDVPKAAKDLKPTPPPDLRGLQVLVVDDNRTAREIMVETIRSFQMGAVAAASGEEALQALERAEEPFDLILLDWKMPGMGGVETARAIKLHQDLGEAPIICMISAYGREDLLQQSERNFLDAFLHKPVNQSLLFDTIMGLFGRQSNLAQVEPAAGDADQGGVIDLGGHRVLLVEDNEINQEVAREWLESAGLDIETVGNGRLALEAVQAKPYDAVLMDIQMPEMDGLEATRRIRELGTLQDLPIIAMTAHALKGDRERCLEAGMDDYITKPIDPPKLFATLANWLEVTGQAPPPPARQTGRGSPEPGWEPDLPGISLDTGLMRANQNHKLYRRLLASFLKDYGQADQQMARDLEQGQRESAGRLAHSIKGVAGNIGALELSERAAEMEQVIAAGDADLEGGQWQGFRDSLTQVIAGLEQALPAAEEAPASPPQEDALDADQLPGLLDQLAQQLDDDLGAAREMLDRLAPTLESMHAKDELDALRQCVDEFDIDGALAVVDQIKASVKG